MAGFWIAAGVAAVGFLIHSFVGSAKVVVPFLKARDLAPPSRWLMFLCWHAVTVLLAALVGGFAWAAMSPEGGDVGLGLTALVAALALLTLYVSLRARFNPLKVPPFVLFSIMAAAGAWSLTA